MARARRPSSSGGEGREAGPGGDPPVRPPRPLRVPPPRGGGGRGAREAGGGPRGRADVPAARLPAPGTVGQRPKRAVSSRPPRLGLHVSGSGHSYFETFV